MFDTEIGTLDLKKRCQSLAILDAIICPEWEFRYYTFQQEWVDNISVASIRNGSGDNAFLVFFEQGVVIKIFLHEFSKNSYIPNFLYEVSTKFPNTITSVLMDPAFSIEDTSFMLWRFHEDEKWHTQSLALNEEFRLVYDASIAFLRLLNSEPKFYQEWAQDYYEQSINLRIVDAIYRHCNLTEKIITSLNSDLCLKMLTKEIKEIGYSGDFDIDINSY